MLYTLLLPNCGRIFCRCSPKIMGPEVLWELKDYDGAIQDLCLFQDAIWHFQHIPTAAENGAFRILFVVAEKPTFSLVSVMRLVVCDVWCRSTAFCTEKTWQSCYTWDFESKLKCNKSQFFNEQCSKPAISPLYTGWLTGIPVMDIVQPCIDNQQTKGLEHWRLCQLHGLVALVTSHARHPRVHSLKFRGLPSRLSQTTRLMHTNTVSSLAAHSEAVVQTQTINVI